MKNSHIDALQELAGREFPMEIRLKAGELLGMVVDHTLKKKDRETPVCVISETQVPFIANVDRRCPVIKETFRPLS